jgi:acyl-CoA synthetase (AMP-forming)/AMP-acid ligase II
MNSLNPTTVATLADIEAFEACSPDLSLSLCSTYELLARGAAIAPDMPALSFFVRTEDHARPVVWSHREWLARITQTANMLRRLGVQRGDVVAYILPNLPETHWTIWGAETAGIAFAINALLEPATMRELLVAANARWLVTQAPTAGDPLWDKVSRCATEVASLRGVIAVDALRHLPTAAAMAPQPLPHRVGQLSVYDFGKLVAASPDEDLEFDAPQVDDVASYFCTGGTTGRPKIAVRTHATETANAIQLAAVLGEGCMAPGRTMFCGLPLFHVNAQIGTGLAPWSRGGHVLLGTAQGFRAPGLIPQFWDIAARHRLVTLFGVPTIYASLLQVPRAGQDLSALRYALCGAAPMPVEDRVGAARRDRRAHPRGLRPDRSGLRVDAQPPGRPDTRRLDRPAHAVARGACAGARRRGQVPTRRRGRRGRHPRGTGSEPVRRLPGSRTQQGALDRTPRR